MFGTWRPLRWRFLAPAALLLLALALRLYRLDQQSLWYDEAVSLHYATVALRQLPELLSQDNHPPLYFLMLRLWQGLAGQSEYALRFFSVAGGVLSVALLLPLGVALFPGGERGGGLGVAAGPLAALLVALSPFHIYFSQEARMYTWAGAWVVAAAYGLVRTRSQPLGRARGWWMVYGAMAVAALYTHLFAALLILAFTLISGVEIGWAHLYKRGASGSGASPLRAWFGVHAAIAGASLPLVPFVLHRATSDATYWWGSLDLVTLLSRSLQEVSTARSLPEPLALGLPLLIAGLALGGLALAPFARGATPLGGAWLLGGSLVIPLLLLHLVTLSRPKFDGRYLLPLLPFLSLALVLPVAFVVTRRKGGRGWGQALALLGGGVLLLPVLAAFALSLPRLYFDEAPGRPDFRRLVRYIEEHAQPNEGVVLLGGHAQEVYRYYARRDLPLFPLPDRLIPDVRHPLGSEALWELSHIAQGRKGLWVALWQRELADPRDLVVPQLEEKAQRLGVGASFAGVNLLYFSLPEQVYFEVEPVIPVPLTATFGDAIAFLGYKLERQTVKQGATLPLTLYWRAHQKLQDDLIAFVHLLNPKNRVYAQLDKRPPNDLYPTLLWQVGETIADEYHLAVPPGTPPGAYALEIGLYRPSGMERLRVRESGEDRLLLTSIEVEKAALPSAGVRPPYEQRAELGPLRLLGYELERTTYRPGEELRVRLWWQAPQKPQGTLLIAGRLVNEQGEPLVQRLEPPADDTYPVHLWEPGELLRDTIALVLTPGSSAGRYRLEIGLRNAEGAPLGVQSWVSLDTPFQVR